MGNFLNFISNFFLFLATFEQLLCFLASNFLVGPYSAGGGGRQGATLEKTIFTIFRMSFLIILSIFGTFSAYRLYCPPSENILYTALSGTTNTGCSWQVATSRVINIIERLRYPGSGLRVRVSPFCLPIFADVSIFTRNFYPFPRWSTRKRQTGTGVFCFYLWAA
jgi:hypothetical protein